MKILFLTLLFSFSISFSSAQERFLIKETDSIQLFETYLSNSYTGNIFPSFYKNGLLFVSNFNSSEHKLYYSNLEGGITRIPLRGKFNFGAATIYGSDIYFTGKTKTYNSAIYKGKIENFKVTKIEKLDFCNPNHSYSDPYISIDGQQLVLISNERDILHIKEFVKNENNEWELKSNPYISHPEFDIINPTIFDENTIYFSANVSNGEIEQVSYTKNQKGEIIVDKIFREEGDFNIYKISRTNGRWGIKQKVTVLSSELDDLGVIFDSAKSGYLTSYRFNSNDNVYYFILK